MRAVFNWIDQTLTGDTPVARVIPPGGGSALAVTFVTGVLAFLMALAVITSSVSSRVAQGWTEELGQSTTVRISAPAAQRDAQIDAALRVLRTTPGIADAELVGPKAQLALLTPWIGEDLSLDAFELPTLLDVSETEEGPDIEGLRLRLAGEAPGAIYDRHDGWRTPIIASADRVRTLGWAVAGLLLCALISLVAVTVRASLMSHASEIETLLLVGATDRFITRVFVRAALLRALLGASVGLLMAAIVYVLLPVTRAGAFAQAMRLDALDWVLLLLVPLVIVITTYGAARITARSALRHLV